MSASAVRYKGAEGGKVAAANRLTASWYLASPHEAAMSSAKGQSARSRHRERASSLRPKQREASTEAMCRRCSAASWSGVRPIRLAFSRSSASVPVVCASKKGPCVCVCVCVCVRVCVRAVG